ncbi:hypothetical protein ONS95_000356 [Cadophora gregata]|uniref:uncharacterized protein n=1 Tax=Cadophora gregata TaxID=51156 RepID=UPI0026DDB719|nr:uncharacterized protein ONS95_000356 [Cadophora gregata]KAK0125636.1 hypothetical protein ONS96_009473 [Cadophora gregata f. sp. sojae]KAK0128386.1 hypothetical protein ONS95_000356 [Cadophora gregata]
MAPLRSNVEVQPHLEARQNDAQLRPITLTVTRATTTFTTIVNLGGGATNVPTQADPTVVTTPLSTPDPVIASGSSDPSDNTGVVIGATIGALAGALLLMIFIWKCCYGYRNAVRWTGRYYDSDTSSSSSSSPSSYRRRYGDTFNRRNYRGYPVAVPRRTYSRRERKPSLSTSSGSRSDSTWMRNRRRSGWGHSLFGWVTGTTTRRVRSVYVRRDGDSSGRRYGEPRYSVDD